MATPKTYPIRSRLRLAASMLVVIPLGLASRSCTGIFPPAIAKYPADTFWALMVFLCWGMILPGSATLRLAAYAMVTSVLIECSQLYHAPWIDSIRSTFPGYIILGSGFMWPDLAAYAVGILAGVLAGRLLCSKR